MPKLLNFKGLPVLLLRSSGVTFPAARVLTKSVNRERDFAALGLRLQKRKGASDCSDAPWLIPSPGYLAKVKGANYLAARQFRRK